MATGFGLGRAPFAPGTVASAATALLLWLVPFSRPGLVLFLLAVTLGGTWAAHEAERWLGTKDPGVIVVDEVAGMTLAVIAFPLTPAVLAAGFVLFRIFDVVKPSPAREIQRVRGGAGIMLDDLVAGLYALGLLALSRALWGWP